MASRAKSAPHAHPDDDKAPDAGLAPLWPLEPVESPCSGSERSLSHLIFLLDTESAPDQETSSPHEHRLRPSLNSNGLDERSHVKPTGQATTAPRNRARSDWNVSNGETLRGPRSPTVADMVPPLTIPAERPMGHVEDDGTHRRRDRKTPGKRCDLSIYSLSVLRCGALRLLGRAVRKGRQSR